MENIQISTSGVKKSLHKYTPMKSLVEYIWNGFDAKASEIEIICNKNKLGSVECIEVKDNGYGIPKEKLYEKFKPFYESKYEKNKKRFKYSIEIESKDIQIYKESDLVETTEEVGTVVKFINTYDLDSVEEIVKGISSEFCWFLELNNKNEYKIIIDGEELDYSNLIYRKIINNYKFNNIDFEVRYVIWKEKLNNEYSKYYFINSNSEEIMKENTSLNNKGDKFYHSVYIESKIFDDFYNNKGKNQIPLIGYNYLSPEFIFIKDTIDKELKNIRKPFIERYTNNIIEQFERESIFPNYNTKNILDEYKKKRNRNDS